MKLLNYLERCRTYRDVYALKSLFEQNGMVIMQSVSGTRALCKLKNGTPKCDRIFEDFIFIEGSDDKIITDKEIQIMIEFVSSADPKEIARPEIKSYRKNHSLYGNVVAIFNEEKKKATQDIRIIGESIQD